MLEYFSQLFGSGALQIIARIAFALVMFVTYTFIFYYAKQRNLTPLCWIIGILQVLMFALCFTDISRTELQFYVYFVTALGVILGVLFFVDDLRRDIFRRTMRGKFLETYIENLGREDLHDAVEAIVKACQRLSKNDTGALIVIADDIDESILDSGTRLNAVISSNLLETIFFPKTPLHDGAVIITANKVVSASCYLPLTQSLNLPRDFGTRHRAAIGITEANPSLTAIVVSEETGIISAMHDGKIKRYLDVPTLTTVLECALRLNSSEQEAEFWGIIDDEE